MAIPFDLKNAAALAILAGVPRPYSSADDALDDVAEVAAIGHAPAGAAVDPEVGEQDVVVPELLAQRLANPIRCD